MKYKYKKSLYFAQWLIYILFCAVLVVLCWCIYPNKKTIIEICFFGIGLFIIFFIQYTGEYFNRYVELLDKSIRFNSFRFKDIKMKKAVSFNVDYEDIFCIEAKALPIMGVWAIVIDAKNLPHKMTISFCFSKHKEFCRNLCDIVKRNNSKVYIDTRISKYCGKVEL